MYILSAFFGFFVWVVKIILQRIILDTVWNLFSKLITVAQNSLKVIDIGSAI